VGVRPTLHSFQMCSPKLARYALLPQTVSMDAVLAGDVPYGLVCDQWLIQNTPISSLIRRRRQRCAHDSHLVCVTPVHMEQKALVACVAKSKGLLSLPSSEIRASDAVLQQQCALPSSQMAPHMAGVQKLSYWQTRVVNDEDYI